MMEWIKATGRRPLASLARPWLTWSRVDGWCLWRRRGKAACFCAMRCISSREPGAAGCRGINHLLTHCLASRQLVLWHFPSELELEPSRAEMRNPWRVDTALQNWERIKLVSYASWIYAMLSGNSVWEPTHSFTHLFMNSFIHGRTRASGRRRRHFFSFSRGWTQP